MLLLLLGVLSVLLLTTYLYKHYQWVNYANSLTKKVVGWPTLPLLGNALKVLGDNEKLIQRCEEIVDIADNNGGRFKMWLGPQLYIFTVLPEDIKEINNTFLEKPFHYQFADYWVKNGLTNAPAEIWKTSIKRVHCAFTTNVIDTFQVVFNQQARKVAVHFKKEIGKGPFDAYRKYVGFVTLEAICETMLGVSNIDEKLVSRQYYQAFDQITELLMLRIRNVFYHPEVIYRLTWSFRKFKKCVKIIQNVTKLVISRKRKELESKKKLNQLLKIEENCKMKSLLDKFIEINEVDPTFTEEQIQSNTDNFIAAGQETTALSTMLILLMLGSHPRVQDKLYEETKEIFGDSDRDVTKEDMDKMKYCEAVICETLRLYPLVPIMMRQAEKDLQLDGCTIPKGAACVVFAWGAGRSQINWGKNAKEFVPERWFEKDLPDPAAFCTFSYGKRSCIGKKYALNFLMTTISHISRKLIIKSDVTKLRLKLHISISPAAGHLIEVQSRNPVVNGIISQENIM